MIKEVVIHDVNERLFVVNELYGTFTLRHLDGRMIAFSDNVEHMLGNCLGWHAVCDYKRVKRNTDSLDESLLLGGGSTPVGGKI